MSSSRAMRAEFRPARTALQSVYAPSRGNPTSRAGQSFGLSLSGGEGAPRFASKAGEFQDVRPLGVGHRLHRQARVRDKGHPGQSLVGFGLLERDRARQGTNGANIDHAERAARVGRIGPVSLADLDDSDDRLALVGMVEKSLLADLHRLHVEFGGMIAHAAPVRAGGAQARQLFERPRRGLALEQPVRHGLTPDVCTRLDAGTTHWSSRTGRRTTLRSLSTQAALEP